MLAAPEATEEVLVCGVHAVHTSSGEISEYSSFKFTTFYLSSEKLLQFKKLLRSPKYLNTSGAVTLEVYLTIPAKAKM